METQGLTKVQMIEIFKSLPEDTLRYILSNIDVNAEIERQKQIEAQIKAEEEAERMVLRAEEAERTRAAEEKLAEFARIKAQQREEEDARNAEVARAAEEEARRAEQEAARIAQEQRQAELAIQAEAARIAGQSNQPAAVKLAEQKRIAEELRAAEEARAAEEEARVADETARREEEERVAAAAAVQATQEIVAPKMDTLEDICMLLDSYRTRYIEFVEYLRHYNFTPEVKEELRQLSQSLYELYVAAEGHRLIRYKISLYQKYVNKMYDEGRVEILPYFEIAREWSWYFLEEGLSNEWFRKYLNVRTMGQLQEKQSEGIDKPSFRRQSLLNPIDVESKKVDEYLKVLIDYAFNADIIITNSDGDLAVMTVTDRICSSFLKHEDEQHYLKEGLKYYLGEMKNYRKGL